MYRLWKRIEKKRNACEREQRYYKKHTEALFTARLPYENKLFFY